MVDDGETRTTRDGRRVDVGPIRPDEHDRLYELFADAVERGDGYPHAPPLTRAGYDATWASPGTATVAVRRRRELVGAYYLKANFPGRAAHIANAGYLVAADERGHGIGRLLVEDSIRRAPGLGFAAIQFNLVFVSNPARRLYESLGWREIGRVPDAVDGEEAVIYWRRVG